MWTWRINLCLSAYRTTNQWRNFYLGGGAGGRVPPPPETSDREIFADVSGKKRQGKKGKGVKIEKKRWKKVENWKWKQENVRKRGEDFFFFFFFLFLFAFHFWKRRKFVLGLPKWEFSTGKKHFTPGKKSGKMTLPPQKNMPVTPLRRIRAGSRLHLCTVSSLVLTTGVKTLTNYPLILIAFLFLRCRVVIFWRSAYSVFS